MAFVPSSAVHPRLRAPPLSSSSTRRPRVRACAATPASDSSAAAALNNLETLRASNPVIVGGGPVGSVTAAMLDARGVRATLVEKSPSFLSFNEYRSFALGLFRRGEDALKSVPGLYEHVVGSSSRNDSFRRISPEGDVKVTRAPAAFVIRYFMRFRLLHLLKTFVQQRTDTTALYGYEVTGIDFRPDGWMDVSVVNVSDPSDVRVIESKLVLACDGKNSFVVELLRNASSDKQAILKSKAGFSLYERSSPAVGLANRSLILNTDADSLRRFGLTGENAYEDTITIVEPHTKGRAFPDQFKLGIFPTVAADAAQLGGVLAVIVRPPDCTLWAVDSPDAAYKLFDENFPQLAGMARDLVSETRMERFVQQVPGSFPKIGRPRSLTATVAARGAVVLLGDACSWHPPDTGQGLNAGLEDVHTLMRMVDEGLFENVAQLAQRYEDERDDDRWALMKIARVASPYQYRQSKIGFATQNLNQCARVVLSKKFPAFFDPPLSVMLITDEPYRDILRKADRTTKHIFAVIVTAVAAPLIPALLVMKGVL